MKNLILLTIVLCIPFLSAMGGNEAQEQGHFLAKNLLEKAFGSDDHDFFTGDNQVDDDELLSGEEEEEFMIEDPSILFGSEDLDFSVEDYQNELKEEEMELKKKEMEIVIEEELMDQIQDMIEESEDEGENRLLQEGEEEWQPKEDEEWRPEGPEGERKNHKGKGKKGKHGKNGKKGKWAKENTDKKEWMKDHKGKKEWKKDFKGKKEWKKDHRGKRGDRHEQDFDQHSQNFRMNDDENMGAFVLLMLLGVCGKVLCWACMCGGCFKLGSHCQAKKIKAEQDRLDRQVRRMRGISMQQPQMVIAQPQFSLSENHDQNQVFLAQPMQYPVAQLV